MIIHSRKENFTFFSCFGTKCYIKGFILCTIVCKAIVDNREVIFIVYSNSKVNAWYRQSRHQKSGK